MHRATLAASAAVLATALTTAPPAAAQDTDPAGYPFDGMVQYDTDHSFDELWSRLETAVQDHEMFLVARASASRFAANRGVDIPGNGIIDVFRNDFAVRLLSASVPAGFEAPIRFYITEDADGTADLTYRTPSALLAPYDDAEVDAIAAELDAIFVSIAEQAVE
jgi:uncharacterized protein (DUF302 family)